MASPQAAARSCARRRWPRRRYDFLHPYVCPVMLHLPSLLLCLRRSLARGSAGAARATSCPRHCYPLRTCAPSPPRRRVEDAGPSDGPTAKTVRPPPARASSPAHGPAERGGARPARRAASSRPGRRPHRNRHESNDRATEGGNGAQRRGQGAAAAGERREARRRAEGAQPTPEESRVAAPMAASARAGQAACGHQQRARKSRPRPQLPAPARRTRQKRCPPTDH